MPQATHMHLKILLPFGVYAEKSGVTRIVAETSTGLFGIFPNRLDCVTALVPGILVYETAAKDEEFYVAVDEGGLVKNGTDVLVSVRRAMSGMQLDELRNAVEQEFLTMTENEQSVRSVLAKMESAFIGSMAMFHHD